jgi:FtsH-binding integral membrane protein
VTESVPHQPLPVPDADAEREVGRGIRSMRLAIACQAVLYLALAGVVSYLAAGVDDLGDLIWSLVLVSVNVALLVALVVCSVWLSRRERKIALAILWLECAFMAMLLIGVIVSLAMTSASGGPQSTPVGLFVWGALMMAVLRPMQKPEMRAAFGMPPMQPRQKKPKK